MQSQLLFLAKVTNFASCRSKNAIYIVFVSIEKMHHRPYQRGVWEASRFPKTGWQHQRPLNRDVDAADRQHQRPC